MTQLLQNYPVVIQMPIAWGQMDAMQHLNNTAYFRFFEDVRMAYCERIHIFEYMKATGIGPILASAECTFKFPLFYPDTVSIGTSVTEMFDDRFIMKFVVTSHKNQKNAAEGSGLIVTYNYKEKKKVTVPAELKKRIEIVEGRNFA